MNRRISPLAPVTSGGFSYGSTGFATQGFALESSARIHELLFPEELDGTQMQKRAREDAKRTITVPWIRAQLNFYEIEFKSTAKRPEIKELLMNSVKSGLCFSLPPRIKNIESNLQREYTRKNNEHVDIQSILQAESVEQCIHYQRQQQSTWEAQMQKHLAFVERYHRPDPAQPFSIADVQGTYFVSCNEISGNWPNANELSLEITSVMGAGWVGVFDFVILKGVMEFGLGRQSDFFEPDDFDVNGDNGSEIFCLEESWAKEHNDNAAEKFTLRSLAIDNSHEASNYFATIPFPNATKSSTFAPSTFNPHPRCTDDAAEQPDYEDFTIDHSHESNPYDSNPFSIEPFSNPEMRSTLSALPPRLPFRWREQESSLKARLIDYGDGKTGHIDFSDARCVTFDAEINLEFVGGKVNLKGFKVDDDVILASKSLMMDWRMDIQES